MPNLPAGSDLSVGHPVAEAEKGVTFISPLIGKDRAENWAIVERNLRRTLHGLQSQTDPRWRLLLIGQDRPDALPDDDPRCRFVPFREATEARFDNRVKQEMGMQLLAENGHQDGYVMALDADDILHPDVVAHVLSDNNGHGYYFQSGYMADIATGNIALMGRRTLLAPTRGLFYKHCGSSCLLRLRPDAMGETFMATYQSMKHNERPERLREIGVQVAPFPFPAAIYVINHGENIRHKRGKLGSKLNYIQRHKLNGPKLRAVYETFGLTTDETGRIC